MAVYKLSDWCFTTHGAQSWQSGFVSWLQYTPRYGQGFERVFGMTEGRADRPAGPPRCDPPQEETRTTSAGVTPTGCVSTEEDFSDRYERPEADTKRYLTNGLTCSSEYNTIWLCNRVVIHQRASVLTPLSRRSRTPLGAPSSPGSRRARRR